MSVVPLSNDVFPLAHLDPFGFKRIIDERYSLGDLQGVTSQLPMRCKEKDLLWEIGNLHWEDTKGEHDLRHPHLDQWGWMESKRLVSHLQIYDIGQQALATLERFFPSHDISYVKWCVMVWDIAWHSYDMAAKSLVVWDIL